MKTPRELLLKHHQAAETKLDAVRAHALATISVDAPVGSRGFMGQLWQELFWSCRRVWFGLGAAWAVILVMNVATTDHAAVVAKRTEPPAREMMAVMGQRELLRAELGVTMNPAAEALPTLPRPRSDRRRQEMVA